MKPFWESKTVWVNVITIAIATLAIVQPDMVPIDPRWLVFVAGFLNIILRALTNQPISLTGRQ